MKTVMMGEPVSKGYTMSGTQAGGQKAAATNKSRYGDNFYDLIGRKGGKISRGGGFAMNPELARQAGYKGGKASRRGAEKRASEGSRYID